MTDIADRLQRIINDRPTAYERELRDALTEIEKLREAAKTTELLRAALEPFKKPAIEHDVWGPEHDGDPMIIEHCEGGMEYDITLGDLRRVRKVLTS